MFLIVFCVVKVMVRLLMFKFVNKVVVLKFRFLNYINSNEIMIVVFIILLIGFNKNIVCGLFWFIKCWFNLCFIKLIVCKYIYF